MKMLQRIYYYLKRSIKNHELKKVNSKIGELGEGSYFDLPLDFYGDSQNIHMGKHSVIYGHFKFISVSGHFYVGNNVMAAQGLTVVTDNHVRNVGVFIKDVSNREKYVRYADVIVEDDVWIGSNVTILPGVTIGRGAFIGAGTVVHKNVLPYSVVVGNPQQMIGFNMSPNEIIEHEKKLYQDERRLTYDYLKENFLNNPQKIVCRNRKTK